MLSNALMVQGTTSDAGKSTLVAALCRMLKRRGVRVAPFKPQNMALNSAVTVDGGEIGRAQALQALAAGLAPHTDFNPVLLKPTTDCTAQIIIHGKVAADLDAQDYHAYKPRAMGAVLASWERLTAHYDAVLVEGAGSPAEINLRDRDIANMGFAEAVDCPVILIADIDRGGVFAHLVGTLDLLSPSEQARIKGFVINRFRGDISLLQSGLDWLEARTGKPVLGVLPYLHGLMIDAEDAIATATVDKSATRLKVVAPVYPRISNHNDLDPLRLHPEVDFSWVGPGEPLPAADLIVLPGSKAVRADLEWLRGQGWAEAILRHLRYGGKVIGLCGGYQMLGRRIDDPLGLEGQPGSTQGLAVLDVETTLETEKQLRNVSGHLLLEGSPAVVGYEIHLGVTQGSGLIRPAVRLATPERQPADAGASVESAKPGEQPGGACPDGAISSDGQVMGTYCHGLFDHPEALAALLAWAGMRDAQRIDLAARREADIDRLADAVEAALDPEKLRGVLPGF